MLQKGSFSRQFVDDLTTAVQYNFFNRLTILHRTNTPHTCVH